MIDVLALSTGLLIAAAPAGAPVTGDTLDALVPNSTVILLQLDDAGRTLPRLDGFWGGMEGFAAMGPQAAGDALEALTDKAEGLPRPTGDLAVAIFPVIDDVGMSEPGFVLFADYGDQAAQTQAWIERTIADGVAAGEFTAKEKQVRDRVVLQIDLPASAPPDAVVEPGFGNMPAPGQPEHLFVGRHEGFFVLSSDISGIDQVYATADGERPALHTRDDFRGVTGAFDDSDARVVVLMRDMTRLTASMDPMGMTAMLGPMIRQVIGRVDGLGMAMDVPGDDATSITQSAVVYMPGGKAGLTALLDTPAPDATVPAFVASDAAAYSFLSFEWGGVPRALQPMMQMLQMFMMQAGPGANGAAPPIPDMLAEVCSTLGQEVHIAQQQHEGRLTQLFAVECTKPGALEHFLGATAEATGLKTREFQGHRMFIREFDPLGMMPMGGLAGMDDMNEMDEAELMPAISTAFVIHDGYMLIGEVPVVESALGMVKTQPSPTRDRARRFAGADAIGWGYVDLSAMPGPAGVSAGSGTSLWALHATDTGFRVDVETPSNVARAVEVEPAQVHPSE
ncbi:MAG: hypothetical protein HKO59_17780 [Phycisphaerales bacterium]|nr:hypothetical protein [Phycisphaerae bacterium]NNF43988.1 hypothetical protein [Phycisphaerales bacterium]NNM27792.1 hypothetical protein [Phycisphaerales bacterium]